MKRFWILFVIANIFLSAFFIDVWLTPNPGSRAIPMITLFESGTLQIDRYESYTLDKSLINGHYYSDKAPLSTMMTVPFYGLIKALGIDRLAPERYPAYPTAYTPGHNPRYADSFVFPAYFAYITGGLVCGSIPFVVILVLVFSAIRRHTGNISPVLLACLPFYGSFVFVYTGAYFGHILAGMFLLAAYIALDSYKRFFCAGVLLGLAFLAEYPVGLALPLWATLIWIREKHWQPALWFVLGFVPALLLNSLYLFLITGDPLTMPYSLVSYEGFAPMRENLGFSPPQLSRMGHLLVTPYRGLFFYAPFLIIGLLVAVRKGNGSVPRWLLDYTVVFSICFVLLISSYYMWDGGYAYGPRHLIPVAILLLYRGIMVVAKKGPAGWLFYVSVGAGCLMGWLAKVTVAFVVMPDIANPVFSLIIPEFLQGRYNPNNVLTMVWGINPVVSVIVWPVTAVGLLGGLAVYYERLRRSTATASN